MPQSNQSAAGNRFHMFTRREIDFLVKQFAY